MEYVDLAIDRLLLNLSESLADKKFVNVASVPLDSAREFATDYLVKKGIDIDEFLPNFDKNYMNLQKLYKSYALNIPRSEMPVIEPPDVTKFQKDLASGNIDIFKPWVFKHPYFPSNLKGGKEGLDWLTLGMKDGDPDDDKIQAKRTRLTVGKLKPIQNQLWFDKIIKYMAQYGSPSSGSPLLSTTTIVSKDNFIIDGHHRVGQAQMFGQNLKISALVIPLDIKTLVKLGRTYGNAIGHSQNI